MNKTLISIAAFFLLFTFTDSLGINHISYENINGTSNSGLFKCIFNFGEYDITKLHSYSVLMTLDEQMFYKLYKLLDSVVREVNSKFAVDIKKSNSTHVFVDYTKAFDKENIFNCVVGVEFYDDFNDDLTKDNYAKLKFEDSKLINLKTGKVYTYTNQSIEKTN